MTRKNRRREKARKKTAADIIQSWPAHALQGEPTRQEYIREYNKIVYQREERDSRYDPYVIFDTPNDAPIDPKAFETWTNAMTAEKRMQYLGGIMASYAKEQDEHRARMRSPLYQVRSASCDYGDSDYLKMQREISDAGRSDALSDDERWRDIINKSARANLHRENEDDGD